MRAKVALAVVAVALAVVPVPAAAIERWYSRGIYPPLQSLLTSASNAIPVALLDLAAAALLVIAIIRLRRIDGCRARVRWTVTRLIATTAVVYILFVLLWGLNYRRERLEDKLVFHPSRVTKEALIELATSAVARVNGGYAEAHARTLDPSSLERTFHEAVVGLGGAKSRVGVPKSSLLEQYFRWAAIDGMTDPLFLEIILNPELLPVERPFVLAHEWAHLAGYAHESEANFVAWLTCLRGDALAQYSGWLATYEHAAGQLPRDDRRSLIRLDPGPREDLEAIATRYRRAPPLVRHAAREVYDSYLKANRVEEGIASYDAVVRLMLGTEFVSEGIPRLRSR